MQTRGLLARRSQSATQRAAAVAHLGRGRAAGIADSTGMLDIVLCVEERFGVQVGDADILPENFDSISRLMPNSALVVVQ